MVKNLGYIALIIGTLLFFYSAIISNAADRGHPGMTTKMERLK